MKRTIAHIFLVFVFIACNNNKETDPYADIVSRPPFASITDSIKREPNRDDLYFRRAVLLNTNNFPEPALADFRKAWSIEKEESYAFGIANLLLDKKADSALVFINDALKHVPGSLLLQLTQARALDAKADIDGALRVCDSILAVIPTQLDVIKFKADLTARKGDTAGAIRQLEYAYMLAPSDIELVYELSSRYADAKDPKVIRLCDSLLRMDTDTANLHAEPAYFKGIYYSNINDKAKALSLFSEAISRNYFYLNAHVEKGRIQFEQKKVSEALKTFNLLLNISPEFPDAYYWIGRCQEEQGLKAEAKLNYQRAYSLDPEFIEAKEAADKLK